MTEEQVALSRRAVACKGWRWVPGMATVQGERVVLMDDDGTLRLAAPRGGTVGVTAVRAFFDSSGACLPDLSDPATVGCLLALVRQAWGDPYLCAVGDPDTGWRIDAVTAQVQDLYGYTSEAEALVSALERSP